MLKRGVSDSLFMSCLSTWLTFTFYLPSEQDPMSCNANASPWMSGQHQHAKTPPNVMMHILKTPLKACIKPSRPSIRADEQANPVKDPGHACALPMPMPNYLCYNEGYVMVITITNRISQLHYRRRHCGRAALPGHLLLRCPAEVVGLALSILVQAVQRSQ